MEELLAIPIEVPFEPIAIEKLGSVSLTPNELLAIEPLIAIEE